MTLRTKLPLFLYQKFFSAKDALNSIFSKVEVIMDTRAIIYSIRILIVLIALLMGYMHTPANQNEDSNFSKTEISDKRIDPAPSQGIY